jgi:creatinine amidohydrolase
MMPAAGRAHILNEVTWRTVRETGYQVAVLPWGATEAHNTHLPYGTDTIETEAIAARAAQLAWDKGARVAVLPTVPFGVQAGQLDIPFCLNLNPSTQALVLADLVRSLDGQGVPKVLILNGHGGNDFRQMVRELQPQVKCFLCTMSWFKLVEPSQYFTDTGDHGGELETSVMMSVAPDLVRPLSEAGSGAARPWKLKGLRDGSAWAPRRWTAVTDDTGVGVPRAATREKGERYLTAVVERIAAFLVELAAADTNNLYQHST